MLALLEFDGRLDDARPLVPAVGLLLLEGRLLTVGLLVLVRPEALAEELLPAVGRLIETPLPTLALALPLALPDMLPPLVVLRPSCMLWLIEPAVLLP